MSKYAILIKLQVQGNYIQGISFKMDWMSYASNSENEECMKVVKLLYKDSINLKMFHC